MDGERLGRAALDQRVADLESDLHETRDELAATSEILAILAGTSSAPEDVFGAIVGHARTLCRSDIAQIHLLREGAYRLERAIGLSSEFIDLSEVKPVTTDRTSLIGRVSLDRTTQQIEDVLADREYDRPDFQQLGGYRTIMGAPMIVSDEVVGVLSVWRTTVAPFDARTCSLLTTFAAQGALAVRNVELLGAIEARSTELGRRVDQLEALSEVGDVVSSSLDVDEVLGAVVDLAVELSDADGGSLLEFDSDTNLFTVRMVAQRSGGAVPDLETSRIHLDETLVGRACRERRPMQVADLADARADGQSDRLRDEHLAVLRRAGWRSVAVVPLIRSDRLLGALVVRRLSPGRFGDDVCALLQAFANQSAIALGNAQLYRELERQSGELAEASRHKSEFLASMSHELRTPLNAVIGFSEVLLERMFGEINDRQEDYLRDILSSGRHLLALLNDILDLSKVEAGQMELDRSHFSAGDAIGYALAMVRERAARQRIALRTAIEDDVGTIIADELRFKQVLLNLLSNAVKFTPEGGTVEVGARRVGARLEVTVSDTGIGVSVADQDRIFHSFQQGTRGVRNAEGTGLGLTLTKRIVELHGGEVWLHSELGHGSTFGFAVPTGEPQARSGPSGTRSSVAGDDRPTVVVIEDDPSSAELLSVYLEAAGLRPVVVGSGTKGLAVVRELEPDVVVLDIRLPGMDGWDVLARIRGEPDLADTPVVVVSVLPDRRRGMALGASDYLVKPVSREVLLGALRRLLPLPSDRPERRVAVIVDDDRAAAELAALSLEPAGWAVHTCQRADEVFALVHDTDPSVVIVDLLMPEMDGFELIDRLRSDPSTAAVPIVVLTAVTLSPAQRALLEGRIEFVTSKNATELRLLADRLSEASGTRHASGPGHR